MRNSVLYVLLMIITTSGALAAEQKNIFIAGSLGFTIQPPIPAGGGSYQVAIFNLPAENGFSGNVNIQRQEYPDSLAAYDKLTLSQFKQYGMTLLSRRQGKGEYVYEYTGQMQGRSLHWYARAISAPPYVYLVTATAAEESWLKQKSSLVGSVESFAHP